MSEDRRDRPEEPDFTGVKGPTSPREEPPRDRREPVTTLLGLGHDLPSIAPSLPVSRPARVWHDWLSTVSGRRRRGPPDSLAPEEAALDLDPEALTSAREVDVETADSIAWEKIWLATQRRPWRSLAVIPVGSGAFTPRVAGALAGVGSRHLGLSMRIVDATGVTLARLESFLGEIRARRGIVALGPVLESPASLALARAADAAILCLVLGESAISGAQQTIEEVGRERFLGSVLLRP